MRLLVVRHGECEANVHGIVAGARDDSPLTQHGIDEAAMSAEKLIGFHGLIISSPLQRALHTAEIIRDIVAPGEPIRIEPLFVERDVGEVTGRSLDEYFAMEKSDVPILNAETYVAMFDRVRRGIEMLITINETTLLVTHNGTYRMITCVVNGFAPHDFVTIPSLQNAEVKVFNL
jgi:broad specificity phosphatase PhoE